MDNVFDAAFAAYQADLAAATARAERAERVLRAIVAEDWDTLAEMAGASEDTAEGCRFSLHSSLSDVMQTRAMVIDGAAQATLDAIAEEGEA